MNFSQVKLFSINVAMGLIIFFLFSVTLDSAVSGPVNFQDDYHIEVIRINASDATASNLKGSLHLAIKAFSDSPVKPIVSVQDFGSNIFKPIQTPLASEFDKLTSSWIFNLEYQVPLNFSGSFGITAVNPKGSFSKKSYFYRNIRSDASKVHIEPFTPATSNSVLNSNANLSIATPKKSSAQGLETGATLDPETSVNTLADTIGISGYATYWSEPDNSEKPFSGIEINLWDRDFSGEDDLLATYTTDQQGYYSVVNINRTDSDEGGAVDVYATITFSFEKFTIQNEQASVYKIETTPLSDIAAGNSTININLDSTNTLAPLGCIFNAMNSAVKYLSDNLSVSRESIKVYWPSVESTNYRFGYTLPGGSIVSEKINIASYSQWKKASVQHEYGHSVMMHLYGYNYSNWPMGSSSPSPHYVNSESSLEFALKEGFAEFFPCMINSSATMLTQFSNTSTPNIETNEWWKGSGSNTDGSIIEGAVASIFWDMVDNNTMEGSTSPDDDSLSSMQSKIFTVMSEYKPTSIVSFWDSWLLKGYGSISQLKEIYDTHRVSVTMPSNNIPSVMVTAPSSPETPSSGFNITWNSYDGDGDTLRVSLFYDNDKSPGSEQLIAENLQDTGSYVWDFSGVTPGIYYIKAVVTDTKGGAGDDWSDGTLSVNFNTNPPVIKMPIPTLYAVKNNSIILDLTPYESDSEDSDSSTLTWSVSQQDNCTVSGENSSDDIITLTPTIDFIGEDELYFVLSDSGGKTTSQLVRVIWTDSDLKALDISNFTFSHLAHQSYPLTDLKDGQKNYQQDFAANIGSATESSMILDLGSDRVVTGLVIYNDGEYGAQNAKVQLATSDNSSNFITLGEFSDLDRTPQQPCQNNLYISPAYGRYLKILFSGFHSSGWFQLNEIEVKGFEPVSPSNAEVESIVSDPLAVNGRGTDKLIDSITLLNGDYAVINNREKVTLTFDFGQTTEIFGFNIVNDSVYGASAVKLKSTVLSDPGQASPTAYFDNLIVAQDQVMDNKRYFNMITSRFMVLEFSDFSHSSYFQLNEISFMSQGTATGGTGITQLEIQHSDSAQGSYPGFDITRVHNGVKQFNNDFVVRHNGTGVEITLDLGADKSISEIRHYNDGQYGASKVSVKYASQTGYPGFTALATYDDLALAPSVVNQNVFSFQAVTARYVKFSYTSFNDPLWFQLNEIEIYGGSDQASGPENQLQIIKAESTPVEFPGYEASHLYNGIKIYNSDYAVAHSGSPVSIDLDLGSDRPFNTLKLFNDGLFGAKTVEVFKAVSATPDIYESVRVFSPLKASAAKSTENILSFNEVTARYIRIKATAFYSASWFQLNEIEVYKYTNTASGLINPVDVNLFNVVAWPGFEESKVIDGMKSYNNDFACRNFGTSLYLIFDLGKDYNVTGLSHVNDGEYGADSVLVKYSRSTTPDVFITVKTFTNLSGTPNSPNENLLDFDVPVEARYIRLDYTEFHNSSWFQLNEIEFYGSQKESSSPAEASSLSADASSLSDEVSSLSVDTLSSSGDVFFSSVKKLNLKLSPLVDQSALKCMKALVSDKIYTSNEVCRPDFSYKKLRKISRDKPSEIKVTTETEIALDQSLGFNSNAYYKLYHDMGYDIVLESRILPKSEVQDFNGLANSADPMLLEFVFPDSGSANLPIENRDEPIYEDILFAMENFIDCFSSEHQFQDENYIDKNYIDKNYIDENYPEEKCIEAFLQTALYAPYKNEANTHKKLWEQAFRKIMKCRKKGHESMYNQILLRAFMFLPALMEAQNER